MFLRFCYIYKDFDRQLKAFPSSFCHFCACELSPGWGHLITWMDPSVGHLNGILAQVGGNLNNNFQKHQMPRGLPGGMLTLQFDQYIRINYSWNSRMFWSKLCKLTWNCAWNLAFPVFILPIVWNMCENLPYESVYFKKLHNEQECYWPTIYRAGAVMLKRRPCRLQTADCADRADCADWVLFFFTCTLIFY